MEEFVDKLAAKVAKLRGGAPWDAGVDLTPLPEPGALDRGWQSHCCLDSAKLNS